MNGAIVKADVLNAHTHGHSKAAYLSKETSMDSVPRSGEAMRLAVARAMARSNREIPHYYLQTEVDMEPLLTWLEDYNKGVSVKDRILYGALLIKAVGLAMKKYPELNGFYVDQAFHPAAGVHVRLAISLRRGGLVSRALHDCDKRPISDLMSEFRGLVNRARSGKLRSSEISDATVTVTSLGERGVETVFGVIYPPQVALVGFGSVTERPWAEDGMVGVRRAITATLSADHRASNGHRGGLFLRELKHMLSHPQLLKE